MDKEQQRLSLEGCGAADASERKVAQSWGSSGQLANEQTVPVIIYVLTLF